MRVTCLTSEHQPEPGETRSRRVELFLQAALCIAFLQVSASCPAAVDPQLEQQELDALRAKSPVAISIRVDAVDLSGGDPAVQIEVDATVISVKRGPDGLAADDSIAIRYTADYQRQARARAELEEKAREGWAGVTPPREPMLLLPGDVVNAYLSPTADPATWQRFAEAEWTEKPDRAVVELGQPFRMADHDAVIVPHESGNLVVITTGWAVPPCPEGRLCRAPVRLGVDVLDAAGRLHEVFLRKGQSASSQGIPYEVELLETDTDGFVELVFSGPSQRTQDQ